MADRKVDRKLAHEIADSMLWECAEKSENGTMNFWYNDIDREFGTDLHNDPEMVEAIIEELDWDMLLDDPHQYSEADTISINIGGTFCGSQYVPYDDEDYEAERVKDRAEMFQNEPEWAQRYLRLYKEHNQAKEDDRMSGWRPGDAPWNAPGMSVSDFI